MCYSARERIYEKPWRPRERTLEARPSERFWISLRAQSEGFVSMCESLPLRARVRIEVIPPLFFLESDEPKAPNTKIQAPEKSQNPSTNQLRTRFGDRSGWNILNSSESGEGFQSVAPAVCSTIAFPGC